MSIRGWMPRKTVALTNVTVEERAVRGGLRLSTANGIVPERRGFLARVEKELHVRDRIRILCQPLQHGRQRWVVDQEHCGWNPQRRCDRVELIGCRTTPAQLQIDQREAWLAHPLRQFALSQTSGLPRGGDAPANLTTPRVFAHVTCPRVPARSAPATSAPCRSASDTGAEYTRHRRQNTGARYPRSG
jgi:hypothetical protein